MIALLILVAYLTGAIPTSYVVARLVRGIDLREHGSGNLGATNAYRVLGWPAAIPIFLVDIGKGWLPTAFFPRLDGSPVANWALAYGAAAIIGHVWSIYVGFRGGKGVATSAGVLLALAPTAVAGGFIVWFLLVWLTGYVSLGSIVAAALVPVATFATQGRGPVFWLTAALALFVIWAHRANIRRLLSGTENRFGRKSAGSP
jgi:acyl phosphate:glycerol-3-phosphate acyltransferase